MDFVKRAADAFDLSYSEITRLFMCEGILCLFFELNKSQKIGVTKKDYVKLRNKVLKQNISVEEKHKILSKIYFETRKATEFKIGDRI